MRNTKRDVAIHFIIGAVLAVIALILFFFKFNFKDLVHFITRQAHFSLGGLIFAVLSGVFLMLGIFGAYVYSVEKKTV
ncbi:MAG: hypothetical protein K5669_08455 [Lachnospiraceae bacterium]|nr:hypothetical protein [Lachnospiraceae bacterium]